MTSRLPDQRRHPADGTAATSRLLVPALIFVALVVAAVGSLGAPTGQLSPSDGAYTTAAWIGAAVMAATALATLADGQSVSPRKRSAPRD